MTGVKEMDGPFVDENEHYYPESIIVFALCVFLGCLLGGTLAMLFSYLTKGFYF